LQEKRRKEEKSDPVVTFTSHSVRPPSKSHAVSKDPSADAKGPARRMPLTPAQAVRGRRTHLTRMTDTPLDQGHPGLGSSCSAVLPLAAAACSTPSLFYLLFCLKSETIGLLPAIPGLVVGRGIVANQCCLNSYVWAAGPLAV